MEFLFRFRKQLQQQGISEEKVVIGFAKSREDTYTQQALLYRIQEVLSTTSTTEVLQGVYQFSVAIKVSTMESSAWSSSHQVCCSKRDVGELMKLTV